MQALLGEFFGTMVLVLFGCGVVANVTLEKTKGNKGGIISITAGWGFAVMLGVFIAEAVGSRQADINPAVTFIKIFMGIYPVKIALLTMVSQFLGAFYGACLVYWFYKPYFAATADKETKLGVFCTIPAIRSFGNAIYCEFLGTILLVFSILSIYSKLDSKIAVEFGPYLVGMLIWAIGLSFGGTTGYAINPARDFGPRLVHAIMPIPGKGKSDWKYAMVPFLAPFAGALVAFGLAVALGVI